MKIYRYEFKELELDIDEIIEELNFTSKNRFIMILDLKIIDYIYYIKIFKAYRLKIDKIYFIKDILLENFDEYICFTNEKYIYISREKEEILDFNKDDNIDLTGMKVVNISEEIDNIFSNVDSTNAKNYMRVEIFKSEYILIFLVIFILLNYLLANKLFNDSKLINNIKEINKKIDINTRELEKEKLNLEKLNNIKTDESFYDELENNNVEKIIKYLLELNNKGIKYYEIIFSDKKILIEGVCEKLEILNENIKKFEIEDLKLKNKKIYFKISHNLEYYD